MDIYSKEVRSKVMARVKSKDTKPELLVRRYLHSRGYYYRKNVKKLPGTPDIVLRKYGVAIFIHGCFWHGHEADGEMPASNCAYWQKKIARNKQRDALARRKLIEQGWVVLTIWECQLKPKNRTRTLLGLELCLNKALLNKFGATNNRKREIPSLQK